MRIALICKRLYTNRDLIDDRFGRLYHIPVQLAKRGHDVLVIAFDYKRGRPRDERQIQGVDFISLPADSLLDRSRMVPRLVSELRRFQPTVLVASGDTYLGALAALFARLHRIPWAFDIYDDYRYFRAAGIPGMKALFWVLVRRCDHVFVAGKSLYKLVEGKAKSASVIENGIDPELFREGDQHACRRELGIPVDEAVVGFFGSIERKRGAQVLMDAVTKLRQKKRNVRLLIAGRNNLNLDMDGDGIDYRGPVPQSTVPVMINASDVVVIPYERDPLVEATSACKIAEYLACGRPVVATRVSDMAELFADLPEILAEPGDADDLARKITLQLERRIVSPFRDTLTWASLATRAERELRTLECGNPRVPH